MATKVWRVKKPVVAPDAGIKNTSGETDSSQQQKSIWLDRLKLGPKKKLLVIPLRGIFVHRVHRCFPENIPRNRRPDFCYGNFLVYVRPYCVDFLKFCFKRFHVGLWSSTREQNLQGILANVMGDLKNKLFFTWDQEHCTDSGFMCLENQDKPLLFKELSHLWEKKYPNLPWSDGEYSASNTLLFTYPEKALLNPVLINIWDGHWFYENLMDNIGCLVGMRGRVLHFFNQQMVDLNNMLERVLLQPNTAIFPPSYDPENKNDDLLGPKGELRVFLNGLAEAEDVQSYVESHPIGDPEITPSHPEWDYYCKIICSFNKKRNGDHVKLI